VRIVGRLSLQALLSTVSCPSTTLPTAAHASVCPLLFPQSAAAAYEKVILTDLPDIASTGLDLSNARYKGFTYTGDVDDVSRGGAGRLVLLLPRAWHGLWGRAPALAAWSGAGGSEAGGGGGSRAR
jgi:hypothetical protein